MKVRLTFIKDPDVPKYLGRNIPWADETKVELYWRCASCYFWYKTNRAFQEKNNKLIVKHGVGSMMVWGCFSDLHNLLQHIEAWILLFARNMNIQSSRYDLMLKLEISDIGLFYQNIPMYSEKLNFWWWYEPITPIDVFLNVQSLSRN